MLEVGHDKNVSLLVGSFVCFDELRDITVRK